MNCAKCKRVADEKTMHIIQFGNWNTKNTGESSILCLTCYGVWGQIFKKHFGISVQLGKYSQCKQLFKDFLSGKIGRNPFVFR